MNSRMDKSKLAANGFEPLSSMAGCSGPVSEGDSVGEEDCRDRDGAAETDGDISS